jgi:manganese/zinc/iron transport system permease protein
MDLYGNRAMNELFWDFFSMQDPNVRWVITGTVLLGLSAGALGCFAVLRRRALVGDAVAHAILPGVCLAFLVAGDKNPLYLLGGAVLFGWISIVVMDYVIAHSKISADASIGMVLSVFFGLGVVMLTYIQSTGNVNQSGLNAFLFGNAASMLRGDVMVFGLVSFLVLIAIVLLYKELKLITFDPSYARVIGYPMKRMEFLIGTLLVVTITAGLQAVGVVLMASMLIIPAAAARYWTDALWVMLLIAALVGAFSGISGSFISYTAPGMPTGPWMVVSAALLFTFSYLLAPKRGEIRRWIEFRRYRHKVNYENVLKTLYHLEEADEFTNRSRTIQDLQKKRRMKLSDLKRGLKSLIDKGYVVHFPGKPDGYQLMEPGRREAKRIVRVHRLWELYLTEQLELAGDHVHDDAESMEHVITPEIEAELAKKLGEPKLDPHASRIPYESRGPS